ncbi:Nucleotidylyl transferase [Leucogyrophana mollusca]|uniref:Nucleotidylyl transferase n=1 Tax=Leucogyrophana mollusca TaxID=85980 RepID=A0ACB8BSZ4_9AGAM|nr:Nucleotidylyl transferase [Leucogyrophana mollusca]
MDNASVLSDEDYDVISNPGQRSLESSIADFGHIPSQNIHEPPPSEAVRQKLNTVSLSATDIQTYVRGVVDSSVGRSISYPVEHRTMRVYVDGVFDTLTAGHVLQLRQAKLSFPSVYLVVGVFSDELCQEHNNPARFSHEERCELIRHCRWVDEVLPEAPWTVDDQFVIHKRIDYVAFEEGSSVNPEFDKVRLKGYDNMKKLGRVIPTRRTSGLTSTRLAVPLATSTEGTPYRRAPELPVVSEPSASPDDVILALNTVHLDNQE